jgi:hypothetical protein
MKDVKNPLSIVPVRLSSIVPVRFPTAEVVNLPAIASVRSSRPVVLLTSTAPPAPAFNTSVRPPTPIFFDDSIHLPTGGLDKDRVIDCIAAFVSKMLHKLTPEYSRDWFETTVRKLLREDRSPFDRLTVAAAMAGDENADRELGRVYVEIQRGELSSGPGRHLHVREYVEHRILRETHKRRPGRRLTDNFVRDPEMCALIWEISRALRKFGVHPTRSPGTMDTERAESAISFLVAALDRLDDPLGYPLKEKTLQEIWVGPTGKLVREIFSARARGQCG